MKKKLLISHLFALGVLLILASCGKEETKMKTNADMIVGSWVLTDAVIDPPDFSTGSDLYATMDDCEQDNVLIFESPSSYVKNEGARKCNPATLQDSQGSYAWDSYESVLSITLDNKTKSYQIHELNSSTLIKAERIEFAGGERVITYTFAKQ